jgi:DNA-binding protein H-NS
MPKLSELLAQRESLEKQIYEAQRAEKADAIAKVKALMSEHGLTAADISGRGKSGAPRASKAGAKVPAKYRNKATGDSWSGRGLKPKWLQAALASGKKLDDFKI